MAYNKYGARKTNGFSSALENAVHDVLLLKQASGEIRNIQQQQTVVLIPGKRGERIAWKVDFKFEELVDPLRAASPRWNEVYCEAKGVETRDYKLKLKLWKHLRPAKLYIYKGTWKRPVLAEVIESAERGGGE